ncbi:Scr1 family TA system antitoxin-like transcriptional regulator [Streptomyces sp. JNUCC 64]
MGKRVSASGKEKKDNPRRRFAEELFNARELYPPGRMTQTELAQRTRTSKSTISRLESTDCPIPSELPELFDQVFGTGRVFTDLYEECTDASRPAVFRHRLALERKAKAIWEWDTGLVPGLLQTPGYADALFRKGYPRGSEAEIAALVQKRIKRQEIFRSAMPPDLRVIICESVLMRRVGDNQVMHGQLASLLKHVDRPTTRVRVVPLAAGAHRLIGAPISVLILSNQATVVYVEAFNTAAIIKEAEPVRVGTSAFTDLMGEALTAQQSTELITTYMEKLWTTDT